MSGSTDARFGFTEKERALLARKAFSVYARFWLNWGTIYTYTSDVCPKAAPLLSNLDNRSPHLPYALKRQITIGASKPVPLVLSSGRMTVGYDFG